MTDTMEERAALAEKYARGEVQVIVDESDLEWWYDLAERLEWRWARTFAKTAPHWYIQRERTQMMTLEEYHRALRVIWTFGTPEKFYRKINIALTSRDGSMKWFTSNMKVEDSLINRATTDHVYGTQDAPNTHAESHHYSIYDGLATAYDERYDNPDCEAENRAMWKAIKFPTVGSGPYDLLDLGAGTGLALDMKLVKDDPGLYRAVDPAQGMLNRLVYKHQWVKDVWPLTAEEYLRSLSSPRRFDTVISLFGSPSYMEPDTIAALPSLARRMLVLMHYVEGYLPDYHTEETVPQYLDESRKMAASLLDDHRGRMFTLGKFQVVVLLKEGFEWE